MNLVAFCIAVYSEIVLVHLLRIMKQYSLPFLVHNEIESITLFGKLIGRAVCDYLSVLCEEQKGFDVPPYYFLRFIEQLVCDYDPFAPLYQLFFP